MPDGECCVLCFGLISETEDYMRCQHCDRRAHVSCVPSSSEERNLPVHGELQNSGEMSSFAESSPMPNEVSSFSSALSVEIPGVAVHPLDYKDGRPAVGQHPIPNARKIIRHLEHEFTMLRTRNERQPKQLERDGILQAQVFATLQMETRSPREILASERSPPPVQPSMAPYESSPEQGEPSFTLPADCPAFGDTDDDEEYY
ncbi:hypothetical protein HPB51_025485 [Rhipicephalus microplus]|uniref:Uncharacterized protein n=1 Tax=Rhipicephalus microplus TaxID=6941 RepID=A0A9J6DRH2_RHIMP|nr:hypothetical protein HPB51_025485 [Rhipicephalus microplus]